MTTPMLPSGNAANSRGRNVLILVVYTAAIFVSALLLFSVQPLFTKMVLPRLGGSPAVWSVAMVFFQSLLLGGYAYAHYLMQIRSRAVPIAIHLLLLIVALSMLPLAIAKGWGEPPTGGFGDQKLYKMLTEELCFDYVIRFSGNIAVTAMSGDTRTAAAWVRAARLQ